MCVKALPDARDTIGRPNLKILKSGIDNIGALVVKAALYALCAEWRRSTEPSGQAR